MKRRNFLQNTSLGLTGVLCFPGFMVKQDTILGHNHKKYRVNTRWSQADAVRYPVNDCHEMVQDQKGRILLLTNHTHNNVLIYDKNGKILDAWGTEYPGAHGLTIFNENGDDMLFICDNNRHQVIKTTIDGRVLMTLFAPDALRIFQLYVRGDDAFVEDVVSRTIDNGYAAFCLTVDTAHYSRRERDIAKRYVRESRIRATGGDFQKGLEWRTVKLIKDKFKIPLILKGIATAEDAKIALDHGVDWIYVSNHGGRQLDHGRGSMHVLPEIVQAVAGRAKIMVDGSICRGTDIVKAIVSGADLVGIGRLQCLALAAAGETGIVRMLELLEDEVIRCLGLLGATRFAELDKSYLHPAMPTNLPSVFSAFPLLDIEPYRY